MPERRTPVMNDIILVVDDEQDIADLIEVYLQNENYTVFKYYSAKEALACIESTELDLAILDIMMPDINGFELCRKIREHHTFPVIMLTAKDEETDKITGLTLGADDYVTKPFRPLELIARVKAQLRRYKKYNPGKEELMQVQFYVIQVWKLIRKHMNVSLMRNLFHLRQRNSPYFVYYSKTRERL